MVSDRFDDISISEFDPNPSTSSQAFPGDPDSRSNACAPLIGMAGTRPAMTIESPRSFAEAHLHEYFTPVAASILRITFQSFW
jgi:hypothetical protein